MIMHGSRVTIKIWSFAYHQTPNGKIQFRHCPFRQVNGEYILYIP
jgi:hypothetical protein